MTQHDLSEVDLHDGDSRIRLRRGSATPAAAPAPAAPVVAPVAHSANTHAVLADSKKYHTITSPTPGTFYTRPSPDEEPYVKTGSRVTTDSVVCKIEAMKIFNDIAAECNGVIVEILVENAQPVEYGQPLFAVDVG
jgi:acetyl-CoA carboxylase biotin carboxyl carrier protein